MRILLINQFFFPYGGTERSIKLTSDLLTQKGHDVIHFSTKNHNNFTSQYEKYFLPKVSIDSPSFIQKVMAIKRVLCPNESQKAIKKLLLEQGPIDIAHINMLYFQISPAIIFELKKFNIPIVMTIRDFSLFCISGNCLYKNIGCDNCKTNKVFLPILRKCDNNSLIKSIGTALIKFWYYDILKVFDNVDVFICTSKFLINENMHFGLRGEIIQLPNFIFLDKITPQFYFQDRSIVYFGRISKEKGIQTLINAIKDINIKLKIIGSGHLENKLKDEIEKKQIRNVVFLGLLDEKILYEEVKKSMFVVVPSEWWEPFGRVIIESYALGKPVVASRTGGIPEIVKDGETGLLFEPGNVQDLREKIERLLNNNQLLVYLGKKARAYAEEEFSVDNHYSRLIQIYKRAIEKVKKMNVE